MVRRAMKASVLIFTALVLIGPAVGSAQTLTGAGSTFINPIMTKWIDVYQKETGISLNYQSVGSGAGINNLIDGTIDFAGSDAPMNADEQGRAKGPVIHLPAVIGAVCVAYNVNGMKSGLALSGENIADIFLGKIKYWDDPVLVKNNRGMNLPHEAIFTVHRSDGSGTTAIFTDYLSKVSPEWKQNVGAGKSVKWPESGVGGKGNQGVAGVLQEHPFSIGYVELAYAVENKISYARIANPKGEFVYPTVGTAKQAAQTFQVPENMCTMITNASEGYPITGFSWLIVYKNSQKSADVKKFLKWAVTKGQNYTQALYYAAIPENLRKREMKLIDSME
jgi:phosphate transport system substrate-binding protein